VALRWKRTIQLAPHMFSSRDDAKHDWLLYCGAWQVGRVHETMRPADPRIVFVWSLTGPHTPEAPVALRGEATTVQEAKEQLVAAMRGWAVWAGVRPPGRSLRWVLTSEHRTFDNAGPDDWLAISGEFVAGRVHRLTDGPLRGPHWMLFGVSAIDAPGPRAGSAERIDGAKARLLEAWQVWLAWAELAAERPAAEQAHRG